MRHHVTEYETTDFGSNFGSKIHVTGCEIQSKTGGIEVAFFMDCVTGEDVPE